MQLIGFNFKKILVERNTLSHINEASNISLGIVNVEKENVPLLKDDEAIKFEFNYSISYKTDEKQDDDKLTEKSEKFNGISFQGNLVMAANKAEADIIMRSWEKKQISTETYESICNIIMRKCISKAVLLTDELGLPLPVLVPKVNFGKK